MPRDAAHASAVLCYGRVSRSVRPSVRPRWLLTSRCYVKTAEQIDLDFCTAAKNLRL